MFEEGLKRRKSPSPLPPKTQKVNICHFSKTFLCVPSESLKENPEILTDGYRIVSSVKKDSTGGLVGSWFSMSGDLPWQVVLRALRIGAGRVGFGFRKLRWKKGPHWLRSLTNGEGRGGDLIFLWISACRARLFGTGRSSCPIERRTLVSCKNL